MLTRIKEAVIRRMPAPWQDARIMHERLGYRPNIRNPTSFNEKIAHRKHYDRNPLFVRCADKWAVREYVAKRVGAQYLNEVYQVVDSVDDVDFDKLPTSFVAKGTHNYRAVVIVQDRSAEDEAELRAKLTAALNRRPGTTKSEWWYQEIPPRLIFERMLVEAGQPALIDYKFFVFHGRVHMCETHFYRRVNHSARLYDREWTPMTAKFKWPLAPLQTRPPHLDEMVSVAEKLGADFDFVRVDLYTPNDERVLFGELTFAPYGGRGPTEPPALDYELGALW